MVPERQLWVVAGGNGAGKSTFYRLYLEPRGVNLVNADLIAQQIARGDPQGAGYQAAALAAKLRAALLEEGVSFCFETVFSHPSKIDFIAEAKARGYQVVLVFIHLATTELNQARVAQRVSEGGHDVPWEKIVSRVPRTLQHIRTVLPLVDVAELFDNSSKSDPFRLVARLTAGALQHPGSPLPGWAEEILDGYL